MCFGMNVLVLIDLNVMFASFYSDRMVKNGIDSIRSVRLGGGGVCREV